MEPDGTKTRSDLGGLLVKYAHWLGFRRHHLSRSIPGASTNVPHTLSNLALSSEYAVHSRVQRVGREGAAETAWRRQVRADGGRQHPDLGAAVAVWRVVLTRVSSA